MRDTHDFARVCPYLTNHLTTDIVHDQHLAVLRPQNYSPFPRHVEGRRRDLPREGYPPRVGPGRRLVDHQRFPHGQHVVLRRLVVQTGRRRLEVLHGLGRYESE